MLASQRDFAIRFLRLAVIRPQREKFSPQMPAMLVLTEDQERVVQ